MVPVWALPPKLIVRAAVEGVAFQLATVVDSLHRIRPVTSLRATGGALRAPLWRDVLAAALARPVTVTAGAEGSALGVAALGLVALGRAPDLPAAISALGPGRWATPVEVPVVASPDDIAYYRGVRASLPRLLSSYHDVAALFA